VPILVALAEISFLRYCRAETEYDNSR